jgi:hypothetical protein
MIPITDPKTDYHKNNFEFSGSLKLPPESDNLFFVDAHLDDDSNLFIFEGSEDFVANFSNLKLNQDDGDSLTCLTAQFVPG